MKNNIQLTHNDYKPAASNFPLSILANDIKHPLNIGSLFRLSDALGIKKLYLCGDTPIPPNSKINKTSRSTEKYVDYDYHENASRLIIALKQKGILIVSLEISQNSIAIQSDQLREKIHTRKNICLILGSEKKGISELLLNLSDLTVHIPMFGKNSSMNVITAASIACYEIINMIQNRA